MYIYSRISLVKICKPFTHSMRDEELHTQANTEREMIRQRLQFCHMSKSEGRYFIAQSGTKIPSEISFTIAGNWASDLV